MSAQRPVHHVSSGSMVVSGGQTPGMTRANAIAGVSNQMCSSVACAVMTAQPHTASGIHHHGDQDTIVYAISGHGAIISEGGKKRCEMKAGDWALIPAGVDHQEVNEGDVEVVWAIIRGGTEPQVINHDGWTN